ncbi:restriction endonuclease subunit S [Vibrio vulnificus]|uniref:restriction endonuclease subunit S n=1 Tax=Vibrio vulnificus TaxID=672 RepID=UPI003ED8BFB3
MIGFQEKKLGEVVTFQRGFDITKKEQTHGEVPIISSSGISSYHNKHKVEGPGVIIGRKGTLGTVHYYPDNFWPHDTTLWVKDFKGNNPRFIYYFLQTLHLENFDTGSSNPTLNRNHIHKIKVLFPENHIQVKIAAILSAYDDLIENNKRRIEALEEMAEGVYREWFVRFRFPGYKTTEFDKGLPKGWRLERVDSIGKVVTGKTPSTDNSKFYGGDIHFVKTPDMHGQTFIQRTEEALSLQGLESQPSQVIPANSICVSCIGTGGVVSMTTQKCSTNQQINSVIPTEYSDLYWAFSTLRALKPTILAFGATGATMTNLSKGKFAGLKVILPPKELRKNFSETVEPIYEQIKVLVSSTNALNQQKDLLLPRLISGKQSVEDLTIQFPPSMQDVP